MENPKEKNLKNVALALGGTLLFMTGLIVGQYNVSASSGRVVFGAGNADLSPFWQVWNYIDEKSPDAKNTTSETRVYGAIKGLVGSLNDPYSEFFDPEEAKAFQEEITGSFGGIGIEIAIKNGFLVIIAPLKDSPAERAGLMAGDIIIEIDGEKTSDMTSEEAIAKMRGEKGTSVILTILHTGETKPLKITVIRDIIEVPSLDYKDLGNGIYDISVYSFAGSVNTEFKKAITAYKNSGDQKLIIDVRGNPGGYLESAIDIASYFLPAGTPVVIEDFGGLSPEVIHTSKGYSDINAPKGLVILIDGGSASASEIVAGALHDEGGAMLVGNTTFGKGSVQELIPITARTSLKLTIAHWLTPKRISINKAGIMADYKVTPTADDLKAKKDPALLKAIELLKSK